MPTWRRGEAPDAIALAAAVPDAVAVLDAAGGLVGWDETEAHLYLEQHGLSSPCDEDCIGRGHVDAL